MPIYKCARCSRKLQSGAFVQVYIKVAKMLRRRGRGRGGCRERERERAISANDFLIEFPGGPLMRHSQDNYPNLTLIPPQPLRHRAPKVFWLILFPKTFFFFISASSHFIYFVRVYTRPKTLFRVALCVASSNFKLLFFILHLKKIRIFSPQGCG